MAGRITPCDNCPWRVGVDAWAIGRTDGTNTPPLHRDQMERMARSQHGGLGVPVMQCHLTHAGDESLTPEQKICVGFATQVGGENLSYRLLAFSRKIPFEDYGCAEPLHDSFEAMLAANQDGSDV